MLVLPVLQPEWTAVEKSHFIETLIAGLVQPQRLLDARNRHTAVVTGGESVVALRQFMTGQFALTAPCIFGEQAGLFYLHFPRNLQRALEQAVLQVMLIAPYTTQTGYEQIQTLLETGAFGQRYAGSISKEKNSMFSQTIQSYRDLCANIQTWANLTSILKGKGCKRLADITFDLMHMGLVLKPKEVGPEAETFTQALTSRKISMRCAT